MAKTPPPSSAASTSVVSTSAPPSLPPTNTEFTSADTTFNPAPWTPNARTATSARLADAIPVDIAPASYARTASAGPSLSVDPQLGDPGTVFIRAPFTTFPNPERYNGKLCYLAFVDNPDWFLHVSDFKIKDSSDSNGINYPSELEPPRGWCARKKGVAAGEEPKLRCTFCRRNYAGVNAKSMWRRHVFEKHKIAMSNRRDPAEGARGGRANKENNQSPVFQPPQVPPILATTETTMSSPTQNNHPRQQEFVILDESPRYHPPQRCVQTKPESASAPPRSSSPSLPSSDRDSYPATPPRRVASRSFAANSLSPPIFSPYDPKRTPRFRDERGDVPPLPSFLPHGKDSQSDLAELFLSNYKRRTTIRRKRSSPNSSGTESDGALSSPDSDVTDLFAAEDPVALALEDEDYFTSSSSMEVDDEPTITAARYPHNLSYTHEDDELDSFGYDRLSSLAKPQCWLRRTPSPEPPAKRRRVLSAGSD